MCIRDSHDVGQVINEDSVRGQIEGGIIQGLGHTLLEELEWNLSLIHILAYLWTVW